MITVLIIGVLGVVFVYQTFFMKKSVRRVPAKDLDSILKDKAEKQLIDVRSPVEFEHDHVKGFRNIPFNDFPKYLDTLSRDVEVVVMCEIGGRSKKASSLLERSGFTKITEVTGGLNEYRRTHKK